MKKFETFYLVWNAQKIVFPYKVVLSFGRDSEVLMVRFNDGRDNDVAN